MHITSPSPNLEPGCVLPANLSCTPPSGKPMLAQSVYKKATQSHICMYTTKGVISPYHPRQPSPAVSRHISQKISKKKNMLLSWPCNTTQMGRAPALAQSRPAPSHIFNLVVEIARISSSSFHAPILYTGRKGSLDVGRACSSTHTSRLLLLPSVFLTRSSSLIAMRPKMLGQESKKSRVRKEAARRFG